MYSWSDKLQKKPKRRVFKARVLTEQEFYETLKEKEDREEEMERKKEQRRIEREQKKEEREIQKRASVGTKAAGLHTNHSLFLLNDAATPCTLPPEKH